MVMGGMTKVHGIVPPFQTTHLHVPTEQMQHALAIFLLFSMSRIVKPFQPLTERFLEAVGN